MQWMASDFFSNLYTADPSVQPAELINLIEPKLTDLMNQDLCREFSAEEISDALF
jgi:hypothetical protein